MVVLARRVEVTESTSDFGPWDYATTFEVTIGGANARAPEQWVRAVFEGAPYAIRWMVTFGWRFMLGFRLGPGPSPGYVAGWKVLSVGPDLISLGVRSRSLTAEKRLRITDGKVRMTTIVRYDRPQGRIMWNLAKPIHHRTEPYLLGHAGSV